MIERIALWWQRRRCRRGDHVWRTAWHGSRSDLVECLYCPEIGYRIKETV